MIKQRRYISVYQKKLDRLYEECKEQVKEFCQVRAPKTKQSVSGQKK
ncbi:MAG: hypothetical protein Q8M40_00055 [Legionella sp.]|nr:hypothetical protein [Legionella sp.]